MRASPFTASVASIPIVPVAGIDPTDNDGYPSNLRTVSAGEQRTPARVTDRVGVHDDIGIHPGAAR